jgi:hypothetical protein
MNLVRKTYLEITTSHGSLGLREIKVRKTNGKRAPVTHQAVHPPPFSKRHWLRTLAENNKKVDGQYQRPQRGRQRVSIQKKGVSHGTVFDDWMGQVVIYAHV